MMKRSLIVISLIASMFVFNAFAAEEAPAKIEGKEATLTCSKCVKKAEGAEKCAAVITIDGKSYPFKGKRVKGAKICKKEIAVKVTGTVKKGKFVSESTELAEKK